jgi:tetratricopeptide (TPR) repeat protein
MTNKIWRMLILVSVLLSCLAYLLFGTGTPDINSLSFKEPNDIKQIRLNKVNTNYAEVEVELFYNGLSGPTALLDLFADKGEGNIAESPNITKIPVRPGNHKLTRSLHREAAAYYTQDGHIDGSHTSKVDVRLYTKEGLVLAEKTFSVPIDWPSTDKFRFAGHSEAEVQRVYLECVKAIDQQKDLGRAKNALEQIILADPKFVSAYVEIARFLLSTNKTNDGLTQAEQTLLTALRIDPDHANSLVLLGHVYSLQGRFKDAEKTLQKAESIGTQNIWLFTNWGVLRQLEGKRASSYEMFRKAINAPEGPETYERARSSAYHFMIALLSEDKKWQEVDELYQSRAARFPNVGCFKTKYASFRLIQYGDYEGAISIGTPALQEVCEERNFDSRLILSMAYYTKWATLLKRNTKAENAEEWFNRGQALHSEMPTLLYSLARSQYTSITIPLLQRRGVKIDGFNSDGMNALGYSIMYDDVVAVRTILRFGSSVNQNLNANSLTPLMYAASIGHKTIVTLLLKSGADKRHKTIFGLTAEQLAKANGFTEIANLLAGSSGI